MLAVAFAGGAASNALGLPAPWLAGAMVAVAAVSLIGLRTHLPECAKQFTFIVLGLQIGASFTWESIAGITRWPVSLIVLAITVVSLLAAGTTFYRKVFRWDVSTGFFASSPGALSVTLAMAEAYGADLSRVAIVQCLRLFLLVALLPFVVTITNGTALAAVAPAEPSTVMDAVLICAAGVLCGYAAHRLRLPAGFLLGAMAANAGLHLGGIASGSVPQWLLIPAFVLLGVMIGGRFQDVSRHLLIKLMGASLAGIAISVIVSATGAIIAAKLTSVPLMVTLLAFSPGGLEVMTILAFALGLNPAFVATHQIARYLGLAVTLPLLASIAHRRKAP